jgi:hypothetical protein
MVSQESGILADVQHGGAVGGVLAEAAVPGDGDNGLARCGGHAPSAAG